MSWVGAPRRPYPPLSGITINDEGATLTHRPFLLTYGLAAGRLQMGCDLAAVMQRERALERSPPHLVMADVRFQTPHVVAAPCALNKGRVLTTELGVLQNADGRRCGDATDGSAAGGADGECSASEENQ